MNRPEVFLPKSNPYGLSFKKWTVLWWNWAFGIPKNKNPLIDTTGQYSGQAQSGPVYFLAGTTGKVQFAERCCSIPSTKSILFPIIVSQFSFCELPFIKSEKELIAYASKDIDCVILLEVIIDGIIMPDLVKYRVQTGIFDLSIPQDNIWDLKVKNDREKEVSKAASDGFWVFVKSLTKGNHTIKFHGIEPNFETEVIYKIYMR